MNTAFGILTEFCKVRNEKSSFYPSTTDSETLTNRVNFIIDYLLDNKLPFVVDVFNDESFRYKIKRDELGNVIYNTKRQPLYDEIAVSGKYANIEVKLSATTETNESVMFLAHHDINNTKSQNCQDNTASVSNLLQLAKELSTTELNKNIYIVFTDCEESGGRGAVRLAERINTNVFGKVKYVVNLELTANGTELWADYNKGELLDRLLVVSAENNVNLNVFKTPFNDSWILRESNIESVCIGLLSKEEVEVVNQKGYCNTWGVCHRENDTIELANEGEMNVFIQSVLKKLV